MGEVYEAEQPEPRRRVAIKLMRHGLRSAEALRRFHFEVEVLGRLQHPSIARIYEAGVESVGGRDVPYFAMEYVDGARSLSQHVRESRLGVRARLDLFGQICDGVQYGHQLGVVHRDLKPGNLLVGADGRPRIIDYGIARSMRADDVRRTVTAAGELMGTIGYMSPEQLDAPLEVDTRTDVYALGVVLYELLCDRTPFDVQGRSISEALRAVIDGAPTPLQQAAPDVAPELAWIVMRAMEKEPARRYATVAGLAADLRRFLANEPVEAGPPTRRYRLRKLVQRNRAMFAVGSLLVLSLIAAVVGTRIGLVEAREQTAIAQTALGQAESARAQEQAQREAAETARAEEQRQREAAESAARRQQAAFQTMLDTFSAISPHEVGREVTLLSALERSRERIAKSLADEPDLRAVVQVMLATSFVALSEVEAADELVTAAQAALAESDRPDDLSRLRISDLRARILARRGDWLGAEQIATGLLDASRDGPAEIRESAILALGDIANRRGDHETAIRRAREVMADPTVSTGTKVVASQILILASSALGRYVDAMDIAETGAVIATAEYGELHPYTLAMEYEIASAGRRLQVAPAKTVERLEAVFTKVCRVIGAESNFSIELRRQLGPAYAWAGDYAPGERHLRDAYRITLARFGLSHPVTTAVVNDLAVNLGAQKKFAESIALMKEVAAAREGAGLGRHRDQVLLYENLGVSYARAGVFADA